MYDDNIWIKQECHTMCCRRYVYESTIQYRMIGQKVLCVEKETIQMVTPHQQLILYNENIATIIDEQILLHGPIDFHYLTIKWSDCKDLSVDAEGFLVVHGKDHELIPELKEKDIKHTIIDKTNLNDILL